MRNLLISLLAGILITISAIYDFSTPECYVFILFSALVIIGEVYAVIKLKRSNEDSAFAYRSASSDWYDLFLGVILITIYAEWLGFQSVWFYLATLLCLVVTINAVCNLIQRHKNKRSKLTRSADADSKMNWLKILTDLI